MATSKTLTPTNVTIQIPAFTDKPDQRVTSNCVDKEADAINALSDQISTLNPVAITTNTENVDSNNLFARKLGMARGVVTINGYATLKNAPTSATVIGTIESGCRPIVPVRSVCAFAEHAYDAPESIGYITIASDGVISVTPQSTNNKKVIYFSVAYHAQL